jgi:MoaA/NifB/PqqE/SkfB family radical SAM enzyme
MPGGYLRKLIEFLSGWGVKAVTFGTVGEPTLHAELADTLVLARVRGMDVCLITNGAFMPDDLADSIAGSCSTVWFKIPAATSLTYESVTRRRYWRKVIHRLNVLQERPAAYDMKIGWLFEMTTLNFDEVEEACSIAKAKGFSLFHARPLSAGTYGKRRDAEEMTGGVVEGVLESVREACGKMETNTFSTRIDGIIPHGGFHQCYAAPIVVHLGADGHIYHCADRYGDTECSIGEHYPQPDKGIKEAWGGEKHMNLLFSDTPYWCTADCSLREYHRMARALVWEKSDPLRQWQIIH